jgi:glycosyltransferase involved in cell wall biosynthesis
MTEDSWKTTTKSAHDKARKSKKGAFSENYGPDMYGEVFRYSETAGIIASRESFDVIHAHDWMTIPAGFAARNKTGKPLVIHIHSVESDRSPMRLNERIYGIERIGMTKADHIIAVSNYTKRKIMDEYGIPEKKISVVYNAPTSFGPCGKSSTARKDGKKYVLFMGRITSQKGPVYFLEMAKRIALLNPDIHFIMAGSGDMTDKIKKAAADYGIEDRLRFTGFLRGREVQKAYEASDIFVMPSVSEPFGITALEAISCGIPAVISGQSGVSEVLKSCPMVDFRNTNALADTVIEILGSDTLQKEIVAACKKEMLQLDWKTSAEKIINIYHRLVV